ncbi:MAG: SdrD B-like domain-containing protein [Bacteroidota bacterium]|nr:SdrD B-like domain-containing protein [Bacteroidota bacterium]
MKIFSTMLLFFCATYILLENNSKVVAQQFDSLIVNVSSPLFTAALYHDTISGTVFNDLEGNGVRNFGDNGLMNWRIHLFQSDIHIDSTLTDVNGKYSFTNITPGTYAVREELKSGWLQTLPALGGDHLIVIADGQHVTGIDFGNFYRISIGGTKFHDLNGNAIRDVNDPGISNWKLNLFLNDVHIDSVITIGGGTYTFTGIGPGNYIVSEDLKTGWSQSFPSPGGKYYISARSGQNITELNFGNFQFGSISGMKFHDINGNGILNVEDNPLANWRIRLLRGTVQIDSQLTDANGQYTFTSVRPGTITIREKIISGWTQTIPASGGSYSILLISGQNLVNKNFGNFGNGIISGMKFNDINGDGIKNEGDPGLANWRIRLIKGGTQIDSTFSDNDGNYVFNNLGPGTYTIREKPMTGWTQTFPATPGTYTHTLNSFDNIQGNDFGNFRTSIVRGMVFYDRNANGILDPGEGGLTGWVINAIATNPQNNRSTVTQTGGFYSITDLFPDTYTISEIVKPYWSQTYPPTGTYPLLITTELDTTGFDFGNATSIDTFRYRTFSVENLSVKKAVKRKIVSSKWCFEFANSAEAVSVNGLHVVFTKNVDSFSTIGPFSNAQLVGRKEWQFSGATIEPGQTLQICGFGPKSGMIVNKWWWTSNGSDVSIRQGRMYPVTQEFLFPMPNGANVRDEVFLQTLRTSGLIVGIPQPFGGLFGWVQLMSSSSIQRSLDFRGIKHTGPPRGFSIYQDRNFRGVKRLLPPQYHNNRLFAELVTLKLNIAASSLGKTPPGLGELIYEEGLNPLSGLMLKEIAARTDSNLSYWINVPSYAYQNLDTVIRKINTSFEGPFDTISFANTLQFTGVKSVAEISFLRPNPDIQPVTITPLDNLVEELPAEFILFQNYPNPFNPITTLSFALGNPSLVTLKVYNTLGQEITTLFDKEEMDEGEYEIDFDARTLSSGVYFYRLIAEGLTDEDGGSTEKTFVSVKKMVVIK